MFASVYTSTDISIYKIENNIHPLVNPYIISTPATREICNDPQICGVEYTEKLQKACSTILKALPAFNPICLSEDKCVVLNILRTGITFGIREALANTYGWNIPQTSFISESPAHTEIDQWNIVDEDIKKIILPDHSQIIFGDIVTNGNRLKHILEQLIKQATEKKTNIRHIIFFTFGSSYSEEILNDAAGMCRKFFDGFESIDIFFLEGRFYVPDTNTPITIKEIGSDLIRANSLMSPEFIASQYELPYYPLERSILYNAADRAYNVAKYIEEVVLYWERVKELASKGYSFETLLEECFPEIDASKFGKQNLMSLAELHITKLKRILQPKNSVIE